MHIKLYEARIDMRRSDGVAHSLEGDLRSRAPTGANIACGGLLGAAILAGGSMWCGFTLK